MYKCLICGKSITKYSESGLCISCVLIGNKRGSGFKHTKEYKRKMSESHIAEKNPMWKGDKVGYQALHFWVKRRKPKPELCEECNKKPPYDLANKGIYDRNLENWEWICRKCHMIKDGRLKKFKKQPKNNAWEQEEIDLLVSGVGNKDFVKIFPNRSFSAIGSMRYLLKRR